VCLYDTKRNSTMRFRKYDTAVVLVAPKTGTNIDDTAS